MSSTNERETFITVAEGCPAAVGTVPTTPGSVAALEYELIAAAPYALTSDDVRYAVEAIRNGLAGTTALPARSEFFAQPREGLRSSPLVTRYGWGIHHDAAGRLALYGVETWRYAELAAEQAATARPFAVTA